MKRNSDRLLKFLIVLATLIILGTLATLAFLNFSGGENRNDRGENSTSVRKVTSSTSATTSTSETTEDSSTTSTRSTVRRTTQEQTTEPVKTQRELKLEEAIKENANEDRGERVPVATSSSKSFDTQAEAHAFGKEEVERIASEGKAASYMVKAIRDSKGEVTSWETEITLG